MSPSPRPATSRMMAVSSWSPLSPGANTRPTLAKQLVIGESPAQNTAGEFNKHTLHYSNVHYVGVEQFPSDV
jgi:hypothetical protein